MALEIFYTLLEITQKILLKKSTKILGIEEWDESTNQNANFKKSSSKVVDSQKNHIFVRIGACWKLDFLKTKTSLNYFALKQQSVLKETEIAFKKYKKLLKFRGPM